MFFADDDANIMFKKLDYILEKKYSPKVTLYCIFLVRIKNSTVP